MDLFDMSADSLEELRLRKEVRDRSDETDSASPSQIACPAPSSSSVAKSTQKKKPATKFISSLPFSHSYLPSLASGLSNLSGPTLIIGVQSDTLFPIEQQRELAECLKENGNGKVVYYELNQPWGHDTFLLDVGNVGGAIKGFLEREE